MQVDLSGLRALVTGSTKGIGRAIARELAANGAEVVINGRKAADTEQAIVSLRAAVPKGRFKAAPGDAGTAAGVASIIEAAGDVDILVNNVGVFEIKDAFDIPDEDWERLFAINVLSGVRFTRHYGPRMRDKRFGRIIFISSESGVQMPTEMIHYGFTKAADLALARGFAQALAASGVTVNAVLPGPTRTEGVDAMFKSMGKSADDPQAQRDFIDSGRPSSIIKRLAKPEEVAAVVTFLCSREAPGVSSRSKLDDRALAFGLGARRLYQRLSVEHDFTVDLANARQPCAGFLRNQLGDRDNDRDRVADLHRGPEIERLRNVHGTRPRQARAEHRRDQACGVKPVRDARPERGLGGEMFRQVYGIAVAGELRKADHVGRRHGLLEPLGHADREVLEEQRAQRLQAHEVP
jgi:NAD(P)-dependent dehydrogenase (short-subunit alcohol dehydrogenase family)